MKVEEIEKLLNNDKEFKRWTINKLLNLEQKINCIDNKFKLIKRMMYIVLSIILAKLGIDVNHLI